MSNSNNNSSIADSFGSLITQSLQAYKEILDTGLQNTNFKLPNSSDCDTCPPKEKCPPKFIGKIDRKAMSNERIIVPMMIGNSCSSAKTYKIGVRELLDQDGNLAPQQPVLNKNSVTLQPNGKERVLIGVNLANFKNGIYQAEVVIRELEYNQNVLLTLDIDDYAAPLISPLNEKDFKLKWQSWKTHFYCEPKKRTNGN